MSVALLVVLFFGLILSDCIVGERKTRALVEIFDIPSYYAEDFDLL